LHDGDWRLAIVQSDIVNVSCNPIRIIKSGHAVISSGTQNKLAAVGIGKSHDAGGYVVGMHRPFFEFGVKVFPPCDAFV
jgi:hypothetical protein